MSKTFQLLPDLFIGSLHRRVTCLKKKFIMRQSDSVKESFVPRKFGKSDSFSVLSFYPEEKTG